MESEAENTPAAQAAVPQPVMDVMPPPKAEQSPVPTEPAAESLPATPAPETTAAPEPAKDAAKQVPPPKPPRSAPIGVIIFAVIVFALLSALAYFAYSKG